MRNGFDDDRENYLVGLGLLTIAALIALAALLSGCAAVPAVFAPSGAEPRYETYTISPASESFNKRGLGNPEAGASPSSASKAGEGESARALPEADAVDFTSLRWDYGGFAGSKAVEAEGCRIADLKVSYSGLSYKWESGGCEALGAAAAGDYSQTLACLFVKGADGVWRGGKFDWISTSRTSRDFENIRSGYHGWPKDAIATARGYAFVIVSKDGKQRTNVITAGR